MDSHHLQRLAAAVETLDLASSPTYEQAMGSMHMIGSFNECEVAITRFRGQPPWECHPHDELIIILEGAVDLTFLKADAEAGEVVSLSAGELIIVPSGTWHRSNAPDGVAVLCGTSREDSRSSMADDPRTAGADT